MTKRKFYKNIITYEVLSEDAPYIFHSTETLSYDVSEGQYSGNLINVESKQLTGVAIARALQIQGTDPEFFNLDKNGNDLEDFC